MIKLGIDQRMRVSRQRGRHAPLEYSEAVELWARQHGGHAKIVWYQDPINCWAVVLSFKVGDPRQGGPEDGEPVFLHDWRESAWWAQHASAKAKRHARNNRIMPAAYAYELDELGVEGVIQRLDKGNILSGRGQFTSSEQAVQVQRDLHETRRDRLRTSNRDEAGHRAKDKRRSLLKIPFLPVGISFAKESNPA